MISREKYKLNFKTLLQGQQEMCTPDTYGLNKKALLTSAVLLLSTATFAQDYSLDFSSGNYARIPMSETLSSFDQFAMEQIARILIIGFLLTTHQRNKRWKNY